MCALKDSSDHLKTSSINNAYLRSWVDLVCEDPVNFRLLFEQQLSWLRPRIEGLFEWCNWMTPCTIGRCPRYDTLFYVAIVDCSNDIHHFNFDDDSWHTIDYLMNLYEDGPIVMSPSELYEIALIATFPKVSLLKQIAVNHEAHVDIDRWIPSVAMYKDGSIVFLPGKL